MGSQTPKFAFPYPVGTDRVMDGDNAMQALAEKVESLFGVTRSSFVSKAVGLTGYKPGSVWVAVPQTQVTLNLTTPSVCLLSVKTDVGGLIGTGYYAQRIGTDGVSESLIYDPGSGSARFEVTSTSYLYMPAGATVLTLWVNTFATPAAGIQLNSAKWNVYAFGGTPSFT